MIWFLGISIVLNILLALLIAGLVYGKITADNDTYHAIEEWRKWESRYWEVQGKLLDDYNIQISARGGPYGKMLIKKREEETNP